jgi:hypothetical protein
VSPYWRDTSQVIVTKHRTRPLVFSWTLKGYERFIPERFLDGKIENNQYLYLTKWEGYSDVHNTWEPYRSFNHMPIFQRFGDSTPDFQSLLQDISKGNSQELVLKKGGAVTD